MIRSLITKSSTSSWAPASVERALVEVALEVDVEEGGGAAERHRRAVLLLGRGQVGEVQPLDRLAARWRAGPEMS